MPTPVTKSQVKQYLQRIVDKDDKACKEEFLNIVVKQLYCGTIDTELIIFNKLTPNQKRSIISEAQFLRKSLLWEMLMQEMTELSKQKMFEQAQDFDDMRFGKAMLYVVSVLKNKIDKLNRIK